MVEPRRLRTVAMARSHGRQTTVRFNGLGDSSEFNDCDTKPSDGDASVGEEEERSRIRTGGKIKAKKENIFFN